MPLQGTFQSRPTAGPILAVLFAGLLCMPAGAGAAEQVGRVLVAVGGVTAEQDDASARGLGRHDPIYAGDRIRTGTRGRVQIRFEDGAMVDLEPGSTFEVTEYERDEDGGGSAVMSFLKGAMRTITGAIGVNRDDDYRVHTTVATIGVRGTAYALEYCDAECAGEDGQTGLYGRVDDGTVEVDGPGGTGGFGEGQYFFVAEGGAPERIVAPPDGILEGDGETGAGGDDDRIEDVSIRPLATGEEDGLGLGGNDTDLLDPDFESAEGGRVGATTDALFAGAYVGSSGFAVYESPGSGEVHVDLQGRVIGAEFASDFIEVANLSNFTSGTVSVQEGLDITWGSWTGADRPLADDEIAGFSYTLTDPNNITTPAQLGGLSGDLNFSSIGGPSAVDNDDALWSVDTLSVGVNFDDGVINYAAIDVSNGGSTISVYDNFPNVAFNSDGSFTVSGLEQPEMSTYVGSFEGRFLGANAEGALVAFEVREIDGEHRIVGSQVLGQ